MVYFTTSLRSNELVLEKILKIDNVMKFLAAITIVLSIPTMIASFYRMNFINIPGGDTPHGFVLVTVAALLITVLQFLYLERKNFFNRYERQSVV